MNLYFTFDTWVGVKYTTGIGFTIDLFNTKTVAGSKHWIDIQIKILGKTILNKEWYRE